MHPQWVSVVAGHINKVIDAWFIILRYKAISHNFLEGRFFELDTFPKFLTIDINIDIFEWAMLCKAGTIPKF